MHTDKGQRGIEQKATNPQFNKVKEGGTAQKTDHHFQRRHFLEFFDILGFGISPHSGFKNVLPGRVRLDRWWPQFPTDGRHNSIGTIQKSQPRDNGRPFVQTSRPGIGPNASIGTRSKRPWSSATSQPSHRHASGDAQRTACCCSSTDAHC